VKANACIIVTPVKYTRAWDSSQIYVRLQLKLSTHTLATQVTWNTYQIFTYCNSI